MGRVRSPKRRVRDDDFILGLSSDYPRISSDILESSFYWRKHSGSIRWNLELQDFVVGAVFGEVGGWLDLLHALEMTFHMWTQTTDDIDFVWQVQYLVRLEGHFAWQAQYLVRLAGWLFVTAAQHFLTFWEIAGSAKCCILPIQNRLQDGTSKVSRSGGCEMTILSSDYRRISSDILGLSSNRLSIGGSTSGSIRCKSWASRFRGRRSIWWGWRVTLLAPRIGNDVS